MSANLPQVFCYSGQNFYNKPVSAYHSWYLFTFFNKPSKAGISSKTNLPQLISLIGVESALHDEHLHTIQLSNQYSDID